MKHNKLVVQTLGSRNTLHLLYIALVTIAALFMTSAVAQYYNGFANYQDYLNNYYAQNQQQQSRSATILPVILTTPNSNTNSYNGFANYQDYLNNYYAGQNTRNTSVDPCGFQGLMSLFVYGNNNCAPAPRASITPHGDTTPFNGYSSYQAYLDAFYGGTTTARVIPPTNNFALNDYYHYGSYDAFIEAIYGNNNGAGPRSGITPNADYYSYGSYDAFIQAIYGNYSNFLPRGGTIAPVNPTPSPNLSGFFDFSVGQSYRFSNGLIMTVETLNDNRCPQNVQCSWQGDIAATVRLEMGNDIRNVTVSMVVGQQAPQIVVDNASIQFVGLGNNTNTLSTYVNLN